MLVKRTLLGRIRYLAEALGVRPPELLQMAREAAHWETMPALEFLPREAAESFYFDLMTLQASSAWLSQSLTLENAGVSR